MSSPPPITLIIGCTACGKSGVGFELARRCGGEIVVIDSMKVYRGMDIGTAKPSAAHRAAVPYHMLDVVDPSSAFSVARYLELAEPIIADIHRRGRPIFVVGGTALYIKALAYGLFEGPGDDPQFRATLRARLATEGSAVLHAELRGVDPAAADRIHPNDIRRIERALEVHHLTGQPLSQMQTQWAASAQRRPGSIVGLRRPREQQSGRINARVRKMMAAGLLDEVAALRGAACPMSQQARQAVGYAELLDYLDGRRTLEYAVERIKINSRQLAKHQRTWFRRFDDVTWIDVAEDDTALTVCERIVPQL